MDTALIVVSIIVGAITIVAAVVTVGRVLVKFGACQSEIKQAVTKHLPDQILAVYAVTTENSDDVKNINSQLSDLHAEHVEIKGTLEVHDQRLQHVEGQLGMQ